MPDYGIDEVSDQTVALLLAVVRRVRLHDARGARGPLVAPACCEPMYRLRGRTLGLVGYGRIARMIARRCSPASASRGCWSHDPRAMLPRRASQAAIVDDICREADLISLHAPLTPQTRHLIDARRIALMQPTAIVVNTARGGARSTWTRWPTALARAAASSAPGSTSSSTSRRDPTHPLFALDNVVVTNHIGWYSEESMRDLQRKAAEEAVRVLRGEPPRHWLNPW